MILLTAFGIVIIVDLVFYWLTLRMERRRNK
jgi:hypothetical protein